LDAQHAPHVGRSDEPRRSIIARRIVRPAERHHFTQIAAQTPATCITHSTVASALIGVPERFVLSASAILPIFLNHRNREPIYTAVS
jgi:hypothetical protein